MGHGSVILSPHTIDDNARGSVLDVLAIEVAVMVAVVAVVAHRVIDHLLVC